MNKMTDAEIAKTIGMTADNFSRTYKKKKPVFYQIIRLGYICMKAGIDENLLSRFGALLIEMRGGDDEER